MEFDCAIPEREAVARVMEAEGKPVSMNWLVEKLQVSDFSRKAFRYRLRAMERDGQLLRNRRKKYCLVRHIDLLKGRVVGHADGYGYLEVRDSSEKYVIPPQEMTKVLHGDEVMTHVISPKSGDRRAEVAIVEILIRNTSSIIGELYREGGVTFLKPLARHFSQDVVVVKAEKAPMGHVAEVKIVHQPTRHSPPIGSVEKIYGRADRSSLNVDIIARTYGIPVRWSDREKKLAEGLGSRELIDKERNRRLDLRSMPLLTIDGEDARDFDDAVYAEKRGMGWRLVVAIADVAHFVKPNTVLDKKAYERGTSVYFPTQVSPMLPEALSAGACSLQPNVDRLSIVCDMDISRTGQLQSFTFHEAIIRSHARLTYQRSMEMLEAGEHVGDVVARSVATLGRLYDQLRKQREKRGAIEINIPQVRMLFDGDNNICEIVADKVLRTHKIIEECMLLANACAARWLTEQRMPMLYRVHNRPTDEKIKMLKGTLNHLGLALKGRGKAGPKHFFSLMSQADESNRMLLQSAILGTFSQAFYSPNNGGHFGLNYDRYTHFTSPIRRYPDLLIHRSLKHLIRGKRGKAPVSERMLGEVGEHCSRAERRADEAVRDAATLLKCQYASQHLHVPFPGRATGVKAFGVFVFIEQLGIEGLLHVSSLKSDYYHFDEAAHELRGGQSGGTFRPGDVLIVQIARVDMERRRIDFKIAS